MLFDNLPIELERHILTFDNTYVNFFREKVIPELMEMAWKRITFKFFVGTIDFDFFLDDLQLVYEFVSDFDDDDEVEEINVFFLEDDA